MKWYEREPWQTKLLVEINGMEKHYPDFTLTEDDDGELLWLGELVTCKGNDFIVAISYPPSYPHAEPRFWVIYPEIREKLEHLYRDGSLCVHLSDGWDYKRCTALQMVALFQAWLNAYEAWRDTGIWPKADCIESWSRTYEQTGHWPQRIGG